MWYLLKSFFRISQTSLTGSTSFNCPPGDQAHLGIIYRYEISTSTDAHLIFQSLDLQLWRHGLPLRSSNLILRPLIPRPGLEFRRFSHQFRRPGLHFRRPGLQFRRPGLHFRRPSLQFRRPGLQFRRPASNFGGPTCNFASPAFLMKATVFNLIPRPGMAFPLMDIL